MTTYLGKSCSFDLLCVSFMNVLSICAFASFPLRFRMGCGIVLIDLFHIVISLRLAARYLARFPVTSQAWGKL